MSKINLTLLKSLFVIAAVLVIDLAVSQNKQELINLKKKYPKANLVRLSTEAIIDIKLEKDQLKISQETIDEDLFLNETANLYSKASVNHSTFFQLDKIEASSFNLEEGKYRENKVVEFREKDELKGAFHDDVKSTNFTYSNLSKGSRTKLYIKEKLKNPRFLSSFYFGGFYPALKTKLIITADNEVNLNFKMFHTDTINIVYRKTKKKKRTTHSWEASNISPIEMEAGAPNYRNYFPHIIPVIEQYTTKKGKIKKLSLSVKELYAWYYSLVKNLNKEPSDKDLVALVNEITKNKATEIEKVRAIYYWVQENIKYIAFEYALGGFVPREAKDVFKKKYGDCKDNSSILYEMFKVAGIKGYLTWIGTRSIPYKYNELPTPAADNHMILMYKDENRTYFLDATGRYIPLELPTSFIQGKEALVGKEDGNFEIIKTPVIEAIKNAIIDSTIIEIEGTKLRGMGKTWFSGYQKIDLFNSIEAINNENKLKGYYNKILQKGNNKFLTQKIEEVNKFDYDKDYIVKYDFSISDYEINSDDEIYVNLNLNKHLSEMQIEEDRMQDVEVDYKQLYFYVNQLKIPSGYQLNYLPDNVNIRNEHIDFSINYEIKDDKIICSQKIKLDFIFLPKEKHVSYRKLIKKVNKAYKETIVLKEIKK